jgi:outer membrane receptor protein involved in Fe transport
VFEALLLDPTGIDSIAATATENRHDIVVTGERIARSEHQTASSVAVFDAASIATLPAPDRIEQLLQMVPNLQLGSGGEGPTIRGQDSTGVVRDLAAFLSGTRPRTTVRIDGRSATYYELAFGLTSIWDVGQVEVFRSPQTTTQGRNSIGGAIFVETADPMIRWEGKARLIAGDSETRHVSGVVSGPIAGEELAFRLSGDIRRSHTASQVSSAATGIDPNRDAYGVVRFKLRAEPDALAETRLDLAYSHGHSEMPQVEGIAPPFKARRNPNATYGIFAITVESLTGRLAYRPSASFETRMTASFGQADVRRYAPPGLGEAKIVARDFSIEPIATWHGGSGFQMTGGVHFTRATQKQSIDVSAIQQGRGRFSDVQESLGVFGEAAIPLAPQLSVTAGLRYQRDRQVRKGALSGGLVNLPLA